MLAGLVTRPCPAEAASASACLFWRGNQSPCRGVRRGGRRQRIAQRLSSAVGGAPGAPLRAFRPELASGSQPHVLARRTVQAPHARRPGNPASSPAATPAPDPVPSRSARRGAGRAPGAASAPLVGLQNPRVGTLVAVAQAGARGGAAGAAVYSGAFAPEEAGGTDSSAAVPAECLRAGKGPMSGAAAGGSAAGGAVGRGTAAALPGSGKRPAPQVRSLSKAPRFEAEFCACVVSYRP